MLFYEREYGSDEVRIRSTVVDCSITVVVASRHF